MPDVSSLPKGNKTPDLRMARSQLFEGGPLPPAPCWLWKYHLGNWNWVQSSLVVVLRACVEEPESSGFYRGRLPLLIALCL